LQYFMNGELVADVPAEDLVLGGGAPVYKREYTEPAYFAESKKFNIDSIEEPTDLKPIIDHLVSHPNIASKKWVYEQYDSMVGTVNMSTNAPSDAAIVNLKETNKALALTVDCNSRYVNADPETGCAIAVAEAARNIVCSGGEAIAVTNCLNFGNPYSPEVYWQFVGAIKGMGKACIKFGTPVTGGNVSFYNQTTVGNKTEPVFPTPTIGMLGILDDKATRMGLAFKNAGDRIYLIGESVNDISSSEYLYSYCKIKNSPAPHFDLDVEFEVQKAIKSLIQKGLVQSAHDCSDGGLFITLLESAMPNGFGFDIGTDEEIRKDAYLFGEAQSRVVVSVDSSKEDAFIDLLAEHNVEFSYIGDVSNGKIVIDEKEYSPINELKEVFDNSLESYLK
jgi:phosphoribosylformylglycinamidine (FGAM) synthase-like enzyme